MHGYYEVLRDTAPVLGPSLGQNRAWGAGPRGGAQKGGPWKLPQYPDGFLHVDMDRAPEAGLVIGKMGVETTGLAGCIAIAALQYDTGGQWECFYFAHVNAWDWRADYWSDEFRRAITAPARAYLLIASQGWSGVSEVVPLIQRWVVPAIPSDQTTVYAYIRGTETFAMRFTDATVGEFSRDWD